MSKEQAVYSHGHHASVVKSHAARTAENSAGFLLPHIRSTDNILDVGCGPGSITIDLAFLASKGSVIGVDAVESVLDQARSLASTRGAQNVKFETVDANALPYADATFDIVYCHQLLQHVRDPVGILREMQRVCKPGGFVAARDAIYSSFSWYPEHHSITSWLQIYLKQARANGGEPDAGKVLHAWCRDAGFETENVQSSVSSWCYTREAAVTWAEAWSQRAIHSNFAKTAVDQKLATEEAVSVISAGWKEWSTGKDLWFTVPNGEILYRVPT